MSQHSEDRLAEPAPPPVESPSARILPFERSQSELQRAVQQRAQETMALMRDRDREANKAAPLRCIIVMAIALIPVILLFGAVDGFLRAFYQANEAYSKRPAPAEPQLDLTNSTPGVILLQPFKVNTPAAAPKAENADSPAAVNPRR